LRAPEIVVATKNRGKLTELAEIMDGLGLLRLVTLRSLADFPDYPDVVECGKTFEENALIKAREAARRTARVAVADDSGIEVDALGGAPGVMSARYAGEGSSDEQNNEKLLRDLSGAPEEKRGARFVAVIAVVSPDGREKTVRGECVGLITTFPRGSKGFGYDPIFYYPPLGRTYSEMTEAEKNEISHRRRAIEALCEVLPDFLERSRPG
jgi:XTP/dITP diphosphohydrolase